MTETTLLLRQINPSFVQQGRVTSQAFRPAPKDQQKLSVYDGDMITAALAWAHFTSTGLQSVGVLGVTVQECLNEDLVVRSSPEHFAEHAEIDFLDFTPNQCEKKGKRLRSPAEGRGWLHRTEA
ncbi:MAG: hypothetical protein P4L85_09400 [Paludisphaera borealis]|uniref:hypothetical protein n=1 Tax=Paludisphaera borealis TaxID=1387353 RepID=UPI002846D658|nr:hypothetical protein [Paludisphaera borealis]MDR3619553.1 hypothetical protein [Paludisphaera borealis]